MTYIEVGYLHMKTIRQNSNRHDEKEELFADDVTIRDKNRYFVLRYIYNFFVDPT